MAKKSFKFFTPRDKPLKKEAHVNTRKIKTKVRKDSKNKLATKAKVRVDKYPVVSYI